PVESSHHGNPSVPCVRSLPPTLLRRRFPFLGARGDLILSTADFGLLRRPVDVQHYLPAKLVRPKPAHCFGSTLVKPEPLTEIDRMTVRGAVWLSSARTAQHVLGTLLPVDRTMVVV